MTDPAFPLQAAVFKALSAGDIGTPTIVTAVGGGDKLPWVIIGEDQILGDNDAGTFSDCYVTIHVWADKIEQAKLIGGKVRDALDVFLEVDGFLTVEAEFVDCHYMRDPVSQAGHGVLEFRYLLEPKPNGAA